MSNERSHPLTRPNILTPALLALSLCLVGCGKTIEYSGFLGNYGGFTKGPDGDMVYVSPSHSIADYDKFIVEPVLVRFKPDAKGVTLDPEKLHEFTQYFHDEAVKALSENYQVV